MLNIRIIPAESGDCFFVNASNKINIMIDGGFKVTYNKWIKSIIDDIKKQNNIIDLVIVTHIDKDHILGLIPLLQYNSQYIKEIWHNGLLQISQNFCVNMLNNTIDDELILDNIIKKGYITSDEQPIGISESLSLDVLIQENKIFRNTGTDFVAISEITNDYYINDIVRIIILGPSIASINKLNEFWQKEMIARNYMFNIADKIKVMKSFEFLMAQISTYYTSKGMNISGEDSIKKYLSDLGEIDTSITNDSSISLVFEIGKYKFLFLGDAILDESKNIMKKLRLKYGEHYHFTAIKMPHHGSRYNVSLDFIKRYTADEYFFSTNSKNAKHPDVGVIADIIYYVKKHKKIIFNYPLEIAKLFNRQDWKTEYNYEIICGNGQEIIERRY